MSLFCRHNRFTADCPICSKGTLLVRPAGGSSSGSRARGGATKRKRAEREPAPAYRGPYAAVGPYTDEHGESYELRLESVPGGVRLAEWAAGALRRSAPEAPAEDLAALVEDAAGRGVLAGAEAEALRAALATATEGPAGPEASGTSPGRAGELREELRVERAGGKVRIGRYLHRPGTGWELRAAPVMMPAVRLAEAIAGAARQGLLAPSGTPGPVRP
jgi:hypothetical protein